MRPLAHLRIRPPHFVLVLMCVRRANQHHRDSVVAGGARFVAKERKLLSAACSPLNFLLSEPHMCASRLAIPRGFHFTARDGRHARLSCAVRRVADDRETNRTGRQECHPSASLRDGVSSALRQMSAPAHKATALRAGVDVCSAAQPAPTRQRGGKGRAVGGQAPRVVERTTLSLRLSTFEVVEWRNE